MKRRKKRMREFARVGIRALAFSDSVLNTLAQSQEGREILERGYRQIAFNMPSYSESDQKLAYEMGKKIEKALGRVLA